MDIRGDLAPTGTLRAAINLGNPVLAHGTPTGPCGVTVDIARELGRRLGLPVELVCYDAAREAFAALQRDRADICFVAIEPARATSVAFTSPYAVLEGVYAVPEDSSIASAPDVDRPGIRVGVKEGSAYDLFLSRTLTKAQVVPGTDGVTVFTERRLEVASGIRGPMEDFAATHVGIRLLQPPFMAIRQAVATTRARHVATLGFLHSFIEELKAEGFIAEALHRAGRRDATVAAPQPEPEVPPDRASPCRSKIWRSLPVGE